MSVKKDKKGVGAEPEAGQQDGTGLPQIQAGQAVEGKRYQTARGHHVEVIEVTGSGTKVRVIESRKVLSLGPATILRGPDPEGDQAPGLDSPETGGGEPGMECRTSPGRDPRLPTPGTPLRKTWKRQDVVVIESASGTFDITVDGKQEVQGAGSLSAAVSSLMKARGLCASVNGFYWMRLGVGQSPARTGRDPIASLRRVAGRLDEQYRKAAAKAEGLKDALKAAEAKLAEAVAAQEPVGEPPAEQ